MVTRLPLLSNVRVSAPCHASWGLMTPIEGDRVRFCAACKLNVYNLSEMTQAEAEGLLRAHEGHLCVRYYERPDGTILTRNCPIGARVLRLKMIQQSKSAAFLVLLGALCYATAQLGPSRSGPLMGARSMPMPPKPPAPYMVLQPEQHELVTTMGAIAPIMPQRAQPLQGKIAVSRTTRHR